MNIAKYAMNNRQVIHLFLIIALAGGIIAFNNLGKQEDAPFQVKRAVIVTQYPGATQFEVEELVTDPIEKRVGAKIVDNYVENLTPEDELIKLEMQDDFFIKRDRGAGRPTKKERRLLDDIRE